MNRLDHFAFFLFLLIATLTVSCFGTKPNPGKFRAYSAGNPGIVYTQKFSYKVGNLSSNWKQEKLSKYKTLYFYNALSGASLQSNAYCDAAFEDAALNTLTNHLYFDLKNKKILSQKELKLNHRAALRTVAQGSVDGVEMLLDTVVIKKQNCLFDFALVVKPNHYEQVKGDYENFFAGFEYAGENL